MYHDRGCWIAAISLLFSCCSLQMMSAIAVEASGDPDVVFQQGVNAYQNGQIEQAAQLWLKTLQIVQQQRDVAAIEAIRSNLSVIQTELEKNTLERTAIGDYQKALIAIQTALNIAEQLQDKSGEMRGTNSLGNLYTYLGEYDLAIVQFEKSLKLAQGLSDDRHQSKVLGNLGVVYAYSEDYQKALEQYDRSFKLQQQQNDSIGQSSTLLNLGNIKQIRGQFPAAIADYRQALKLAQTHQDLIRTRQALNNLGLAFAYLRDHKQAIDYLQQSLKIAQATQDIVTQTAALNNLGHAYLGDRQFDRAESALRQAVQLRDKLRQGLSDRQQIALFDTQVATYNLLQQVLIAKNQPELALEASEQGRAQAFAKQLAQQQSTAAAQSVDRNVSNQAPNLARIKRIAQAQKATIVEYALLPDDAFQFQGKQRARSAGLYIWVVQPNGSVHYRFVDLTFLWKQQSDFDLLVSAALCSIMRSADPPVCGQILAPLRQEFPPPDSNEVPYNPAMQKLHEILITPIADLLPKKPDQTVVFVPQESLFVLPFAALQDRQGRFLIEQHTIVHAPSIQVLDLASSPQKTSPTATAALIVGNPVMPAIFDLATNTAEPLANLPFAEKEAIAIGKRLQVPVLTQAHALKSTVLAQMPKAKLIHFATHGLLDDFRRSGIPGALAFAPSAGNDGFLSSDEIAQLRLQADLVVLSACDTGRGTISGDGVIGLSRAFMIAGARQVVVSLWQVPDDSTAELMQQFYTQGQKVPDAQALRSAMLETMKSYPEPLNWAPFLIMGSDRR
ncbi:CHAT domain-containing protein [Alkalinema pantanalense CENA528]|uniref:CHAT domain-containing protein n=1 Tax=Alkalinema pantanalense TaxID=1620705 RepID=UPI003D6ECF29